MLLSLMLVGVIALTLASSGPRIADEAANAAALSKSLVEMSIASLQQSRDPEAGLAELTRKLESMRHVSASLMMNPLAVPQGAEIVPAVIQGRDSGVFVIAPRTDDEIDEIWEGIKYVATGGIALLMASIALTTLILRRSLAPIDALVSAMRDLGKGRYDIQIPAPRAPELAVIARGVERLAADLAAAQAQNVELTRKLVTVQDHERRDLARELHDEIGPHLFAVRAMGTTLKRTLDKETPDVAAARKLSETILGETEVLQLSNRRVLQRLSPVGLAELGLAGALSAMVAQRREQHPEIEIDLHVRANDVAHLDEATRLTVYRTVQEGLTNALRHSQATRIGIEVMAVETGRDRRLRTIVSDNGAGLPDSMRSGMGLTGMRERIEALGGSLLLTSQPGGGLVLTTLLRFGTEHGAGDR